MFSQTYSKKTAEVNIDDVWRVWADINNWHLWQDDIDYAKLEGDFCAGNAFIFKPKGMKEVKIRLIQADVNRGFTDLTEFPFAKMYGIHEFLVNGDELEIRTTMKVEGLLSFFWWHIVGKKVANSEEEQTVALINRVQALNLLGS